GIEPPEFLRPIWKRYCALVEQTPAEHRHFRTHEFHYTYLHPGEAELIDADLIRATCLVGTADALVEQVRELARQGLQELMFATGVDDKWRMAEAFARGVIGRVGGNAEFMMVQGGLAAKIVGKEGLVIARSSAGQVRCRRRQYKLDGKFTSGKRQVRTLEK